MGAGLRMGAFLQDLSEGFEGLSYEKRVHSTRLFNEMSL